MFRATQTSLTVALRSVRWGCVLLLLLTSSMTGWAQETADGLFITVPNPITSEALQRIKDTTLRAEQRVRAAPDGKPGPVLKIVYDFNPGGRAAGTRDYGPCRDLAFFLMERAHVHTIAFLHAETTRHTVLPVLACRDIVMSSGARLGDIRRGDDPPLPEDVQAAYRHVTRDRRCPAVVFKMADAEMELVRARRLKGGGDWFIDRRRREAEAKEGIVELDPRPVVESGQGTTLYTSDRAEKLGLAALRKETRQEVAEAYGLPPASLREDPLMGRAPVGWRIPIQGAITPALSESVRRQVGRAIGEQANVLILELECGGGDTLVARDLAEFLRTRKDDGGKHPVLTIAYIPRQAPDTATILAFGCSEIVVHQAATMGDFTAITTTRQGGKVVDVDPEEYRAKREALEGLAQAQGYPVLLARSFMDRSLAVHQVRHRKSGGFAFVTAEELAADRAAAEPQWGEEQLIKEGGPRGRTLLLTAEEAQRWGVSRHTVGGLEEVYALYGLVPAQVRQAETDWLDSVAEFLRRPVTRFFLVVIGIVCLILELKTPGAVGPGVLAAICFILFFWSHSQTAGLDLLAILLFMLGLIFIALEVFVLPGFGVAGVAGTLLVVISLALAAMEKRPHTSEEWGALMSLMAQFGGGLVAAVFLAVLIASYLPHIPILNRLLLRPQGEAVDGTEEVPAIVRPELTALLGAIGVAATPLRPAGKVQFGEEFIDVVAEGGYVETGTRVQVVEIEGIRIVVKEIV